MADVIMKEPNQWEDYLENIENILHFRIRCMNSETFNSVTTDKQPLHGKFVKVGTAIKNAIRAYDDRAA